MIIFRVILFALIALILFSCSNSTESENDLSCISCIDVKDSKGAEILCVKTGNTDISISNLTDQILYFLVIEQETLTLIDPDPDYTTWHFITGSETILMPYEDIIGYDEYAKEAVIVWVLGEGESSDFATIPL